VGSQGKEKLALCHFLLWTEGEAVSLAYFPRTDGKVLDNLAAITPFSCILLSFWIYYSLLKLPGQSVCLYSGALHMEYYFDLLEKLVGEIIFCHGHLK
jgi:hypothetical protein